MQVVLERPVVVFDGECPFCRKQVERIRAWSKDGSFEYVPRQTPDLAQRFPVLARQDFNTGMRLMLPEGGVAVGADAMYEIARRMPGWRWVAWLYRIPGVNRIARAAYDWIARNRYRLARQKCEDDVCPR